RPRRTSSKRDAAHRPLGAPWPHRGGPVTVRNPASLAEDVNVRPTAFVTCVASPTSVPRMKSAGTAGRRVGREERVERWRDSGRKTIPTPPPPATVPQPRGRRPDPRGAPARAGSRRGSWG